MFHYTFIISLSPRLPSHAPHDTSLQFYSTSQLKSKIQYQANSHLFTINPWGKLYGNMNNIKLKIT